MPITVHNPYTGNDDETCSVAVGMQQEFLGGPGVGNQQTEAEYNLSKQLGEWGVVTAKALKGEIPQGTKVLTFTHDTGARGYFYIKHGKLHRRIYKKDGTYTDKETNFATGELLIKTPEYKTSIPGSLASTDAPGGVFVNQKDHDEWGAYQQVVPKLQPEWTTLKNAGLNKPDQEFILMGETLHGKKAAGLHVVVQPDVAWPGNQNSLKLVEKNSGEVINAQVASTAKWWVSLVGEKPAGPTATSPIAAPTPAPAVNPGSASVGSMSHEDVAAMFVKIKDDLAKEQGLNIQGANPALDELVYKKIGEKTGYTGAEVKAKIDAYKADGNKLSALKKKVLSGKYKVPEGKPQPAAQTAANSPLAAPKVKATKPDPAPNGVPTVATPAVAQDVKEEVQATVAAAPGKVYSDEDVAAAYIIAKDEVVANSNGQYTLYTKNPYMDGLISSAVYAKTGVTALEQKQAIANYLGGGKKLSTLKKQLVKQGAFKPQAETLKKSGAAKTEAEKAAEVAAHAAAGYTPTPTPSTAGKTEYEPPPVFADYVSNGGPVAFNKALKEYNAKKAAGTLKTRTSPKVDTGKEAPNAVKREAAEAGDISGIGEGDAQAIYSAYKAKGSLAYLSSGPGQNYDALAALKVQFANQGKDYTLLQLIRVIDDQGAKKFNADNAKLLEKQVATWLTTPAGTQHIKDNEVKLAKMAEQAKLAEEALKLSKQLEANQPPLPADSAQFNTVSLARAKELSSSWLEGKPMTEDQRAGLRYYTTNPGYTAMNGKLRGGSEGTGDLARKIKNAKAGMRYSTEPLMFKRGTGAAQFTTLGINNGEASAKIWGLTGKTFRDGGFLSTSAGDRAAFGGECLLEVECPTGTPMIYVDPFSAYPGENEMLLQAGMEYKVLNVRKVGNQFVVRMRVVNWPGKDD